MELLDFLNFIVATHEDTRPVMDVFWYNLHHSIHLAIECLSTS